MATHGIGRPYVEIQKQAFWRGQQHLWVNRYVLTGSDPTGTYIDQVIDGLKDIEDALYFSQAHGTGVGFVKGALYSSAGGSPIQTNFYNEGAAVGTATGFTGNSYVNAAPTLETCLGIDSPVIGLTSSGKPIKLRKYMRGIMTGSEEVGAPNVIPPATITALNAIVAPWFTGIGGGPYQVGPTSALRAPAGAPTVQPSLVNRQVPRGRKRKTTTVVGADGKTYSVVIKPQPSLLDQLADGVVQDA